MSATLVWLWLSLLAVEPPGDLAGLLAIAPGATELPSPTVWLRREREVVWQPDGRLRRTMRGTLKVLRPGRRAERVELGYFGADQQIVVSTARTWHPERGLLDLKAVALQRDQVGPFDQVDHYWLQFATLDPGSVLDYEVRLDDLRPSQPEGLTDLWLAGQPEPVLAARYRVRVPSAARLVNDPPQLSHWPTVGARGTDTEYQWEESDLPAGSETSLLVSTVPNWNAVAARYRAAAAGQYRRHAALEAAVARETAAKADPARALYQYVVTQIDYKEGEMETGAPGIVPRPATETFDLRVGDCKDAATLLITMLRRAGLTAWPALVRTLPRGIVVETVPAITQFDHVIVAVPKGDGYRWFDPTWRYGPADYLPADLHGVQALVVTDDGGRWATLPLPSASANFRRREGQLELSMAGELSGAVEVTAGGGFEQALRREVALGGTDRVAQALGATLSLQVEPGSVQSSPATDLDQPFTLRYRLARQPYARGQRYLALRCAVLERATLPPALLDAHGPVRLDVAARSTEDRLRIKLPAGLTVRELPGDLGQKASWGSWRVSHRLVGDAIEYVRSVTVNRPLLAEPQVPEALHWYRELVAADRDTFAILERR